MFLLLSFAFSCSTILDMSIPRNTSESRLRSSRGVVIKVYGAEEEDEVSMINEFDYEGRMRSQWCVYNYCEPIFDGGNRNLR